MSPNNKKENTNSLHAPQRIHLSSSVFAWTLGSFFMSSLAVSLGSVIDGFVIGHTMDATATGACGLVNPLTFLFALIGGVLSSGYQLPCADHLARGEADKARKLFSVVIIAGVGISVLAMFAILVGNYPMTVLLGAKPEMEVFGPTRAYLIGTVIGLPAISAMTFLSGGTQMEGARRWSLAATIAMTITDIAGDFLCAYVLKTGMFSLALTTSLSYYVSVFVLALYYVKPTAMLRPTICRDLPWRDLVAVLRQGMPMGVSRLTSAWKGTFINHILASHVTVTGLAAYNAQVQLNYLTNAFFMGVAQSLVLLTCVYYSEEDRETLRRVAGTALLYEVVIGFIISYLVSDACSLQIAHFYLGNNTEAIHMADFAISSFGYSLVFQGITVLFANYLLSTRHRAFANIVYVLSDVVFLYVAVRLLRNIGNMASMSETHILHFTFMGVTLSYFLSVLTIPLLIFIVNLIVSHRPRWGWDGLLMLPPGFGTDKDHELSATVGSLSEATAVSKDIWTFCTEKNLPPDKAYRASLVAEELAANVIRYGFSDGKSHRLELRLVIKGEDLILRIRDNCKRFDPKEYYEHLFSGESEEASNENIGLRMVMRSATEVSYTSVLKLNNLIIRI